MAEYFLICLRSSFFASVMILTVLLVRPLLRKAPRNISCLLWLLVAVRLLLPFELQSPLSLQPRLELDPGYISVAVRQEVPDKHGQENVTAVQPEQSPVADVQLVPQKPVAVEQTVQTVPVETESLFAAIWLIGAVCLLLYAAVSMVVLRYRVRDAVRCPDKVWESDRITDAFLLGYLRPQIYLPAGLDQRDRELIVAHERAHQSRGDQWWKLMGMICLSIHWFNPLVWVGFCLVCRDIEDACDEKVIGDLDLLQRKDYSLALLNSGKRMSGLLSYPVAFGEVNLKQRIKSVLSYRKPGLWVTLGAVAVAVVIAVCFMTNPGHRDREPDAVQIPPVTDIQPEATDVPTEPMGASTEPTEPTPTESAVPETEPKPTAPTTEPTELTTAPAKPTEPQLTEPRPTEPKPTEPNPTEPKPTEPKPTAPQPTKPTPTEPSASVVIKKGTWGGDPWQITSDGTLSILFSRAFEGSSALDYPWLDHKDLVTKIVVNEGITKIPGNAFQGMNRVTEVVLPDTLVRIGHEAFWECSSLRSVTIPPEVKEVEYCAFLGCTSLRTLEFSVESKLETIGSGAFERTALVEFHAPPGLKTIDKGAFYECRSLEVLDLWECSANVHENAFYDCPSIKQVLLGENSYLSQYEYPLWYQVVTAKLYSNFYDLFSNRPQLQSVEIGGRVRELHWGAFADCTALTEVTITAPITVVGSRAFMNCTSLTNLNLPDTVTEIEGSAFAGSGITGFTVPAAVTELGWGAFKDSALKEIRFLGNAPERIDENVFDGVTATAYYPDNNPTWTKDKLQNYGGHIKWLPMN